MDRGREEGECWREGGRKVESGRREIFGEDRAVSLGVFFRGKVHLRLAD